MMMASLFIFKGFTWIGVNIKLWLHGFGINLTRLDD
jgi:hypothetical protein